MANRYWVGGSGDWNTTSTLNWSTTSGGASGASAPTLNDNVIFDQNSDGGGAFTVTMKSTVYFADFDSRNLVNTMTLGSSSSSYDLLCYGSMWLHSTNFTRTAVSNDLTFRGETTHVIDLNGIVFYQIYLGPTSGGGGTYTLASALSADYIRFQLLSVDTDGYTLTSTRYIYFYTQIIQVYLRNSVVYFDNILGYGNANERVDFGTSHLITSYSDGSIASSVSFPWYLYNFTLSSNANTSVLGYRFEDVNSVNNLTIDNALTTGVVSVRINHNLIVNGTFSSSGGTYTERSRIMGYKDNGDEVTITCAALGTFEYCDFANIIIAGAGGTLTGTNLGDGGGNTNITFPAAKTVYAVTGGNYFYNNIWATTSGGTASLSNFPLAQDTIVIDNNSNANLYSFEQWSIGNIDGSNRTTSITFKSYYGWTIFGNVTYPTNTYNNTSSGTVLFYAASGKTNNIDFGSGYETSENYDFYGAGTVKFVRDTKARLYDQDWGNVDLNNTTFTCEYLYIGIFSNHPKSLAFGSSGKILVSGRSTSSLIRIGTGDITLSGSKLIELDSNVSYGGYHFVYFGGNSNTAIENKFNFNIKSIGATYAYLQGYADNVDFTGFSNSWNVNSYLYIGGDLTLSPTATQLTTGTINIYFGKNTSGSGTTRAVQNITSNGASLSGTGLYVYSPVDGTFVFQDAFTWAGTGDMYIQRGTVDLNGNTATSLYSVYATSGYANNLTLNGGTLVCADSGSFAFDNQNGTNFTTTAGTGVGTISMTSPSSKTFDGGGATYNCTLNQGGVGLLTMTGNNTFNDITNTVQPCSINFITYTNTFLSGFSLAGTAGNLVRIYSNFGTHTLSKASGTVDVSYLEIEDSTATGGAKWQALTTNGNVDSGSNTGWKFALGVFKNFTIIAV